MTFTRILAALFALSTIGLGATAAPAAAQGDKVFGTIACTSQEGVRFCPGSTATRVKSHDGVPIDLNVTLPASGDGPFPLVILVHGWGGKKGGLAESKPWAERGYAVLYGTSRGFGDSCGSPASRAADPAGCAAGWIRLDDTRYEVRDVQHLAGLLVDEGWVEPQKIGIQGCSYGGGVSVALGLLRDRVMLPDGSYAPWTSPAGAPMKLAASAPCIPWTDLVYSLVPNGRHLDYTLSGERESRDPSGVMKESFVTGLYGLGSASGYYSPAGADPDANLTGWYTRIQAGEPYDGDPLITDIKDEIWSHHSGVSIPMDRTPAPMLISNGATDDLFPVDEAVRLYNLIGARRPEAEVAMLHFDYGHQRGQNKPEDTAYLRERTAAWFEYYVKGVGDAAPPSDVRAIRQTCPKATSSGPVLIADSWVALHPGEVRLLAPDAKSFNSSGGSPGIGQAIDPIAGPGACATTASADQSGVATYRFPASTGDGYTLAGSTTVIGDFTLTGGPGQVAGRLWDVAPDGGPQTLVARGVYRLTGNGRQVFQLHPNTYTFAAGHVAKLELLAKDEPYSRPSNAAASVAVANLDARLPVAEVPGGQVGVPTAVVVPEGRTLAPGVGQAVSVPLPTNSGSSTPTPTATATPTPFVPTAPVATPAPKPAVAPSTRPGRVKLTIRYRRRARGACGGLRIAVQGAGTRALKAITATAAGRRLGRDGAGPFRILVAAKAMSRRTRSVRIVLDRKSGRDVTITRRLRRCR